MAFAGSVQGGAAPLTYSWSFGDGSTAAGTLTPSHVFADNGSYTVTLTVTDSLGRHSSSGTTATIANVAPTPNPGGPYSGVLGTAVAFSGSATDPGSADQAAGFSYSWSFGDGTTGTGATPSHAYAAAGTYTVTLTATDKDGGSASASTSATVSAGSSQPFPNNGNPPALPSPTGPVIHVSTASQLQAAVANLQSGQTILIDPGTYDLTDTLWVPQGLTSVAVRGTSGKAADVVINGAGMSGSILFGFWVANTSNITFGDFTIKGFVDHAFIFNPGTQSPLVHDVVMIDMGQQFVKSSLASNGTGTNGGIVEYSTMTYSTNAPGTYTNGIDVHAGANWVIRNNVFQNIRAVGGLAGPAVLMWNGSKNAIVVGNTFINDQREIALGLQDPSAISPDNSGGIIADNMIYRSGGQHGDVAIGVWNSPGTEVAYNTVILNGDYPNTVEYRYATTTGVEILYNLTDAAITARDGATATVMGNVTGGAQSSWFANEAVGNLHLTSKATGAIGKGAYLVEVSTDYDGQARPSNGPSDVGADEYHAAAPSPLAVNAGPGKSGKEGSAVTFSGSASGGQAPLICSWTFGDGGSATGTLTPSHAYADNGSYTVTLTVADSQGQTSQSSTTATIANVAPTPNPGGPYSGVLGTAIAFSGSATDPGSADTTAGFSYSWSFGDGTTGTGATPSHAYAAAGTYTVTLTATDKDGGSASASTSATVTVAVGPPVANAGGRQSGAEGAAVTFSGSASGGQAPLIYSWTFGDGGSATGTLTPSHAYADNGSYTVTLTVADSQGRTSQSSTTATIANVPPTPNPGGPYSGVPGAAVAFSGSATDPGSADQAAGFGYSWSFGDGGSSTQQNPSHAYAQAGTYTVTLTVTDKDGAAASAATTASVQSAAFNSDPYVTTSYLLIPNFGAHPTIASVKSGSWSDPAVWSLGRVPADGDVVDVNPGTAVSYDVSSAAALKTVEVQSGGVLTFRTDVTTLMDVQNLLVLPGGELDIGTQANPVAAGVKAEVVFLNQALDTALDPEQYGNGLIALGTVRSYGAAKAPFVALSQEAQAGDSVLHLATPAAGWQPGDRLQLPDTRQLPGNDGLGYTYSPQWESPTVQNISPDGLTVTLTASLQYSHLGARDVAGGLSLLPHVADMTRNVSIHSQSATGTRGYALFTHRADVSINYTSFGGMGRTKDSGFDDTTFNSSGQVTHVGTNQENRNAITFLDLFGPTVPQTNGYQFTFVGNTVTCPLTPMPFIWGMNAANSHYGLIQGNNVVNWNGAGINVDHASSYNVFDGNFVMRVTGTSQRFDQGLQGNGMWFGNPNNYITNNVATDINGSSWNAFSYGYDIDVTTGAAGGGIGAVTVPAYQGADPSKAGQSRSINMNDTPLLQFSGNEVYGATSAGMTMWYVGTQADTFYADAKGSVIKNFVAWHFTQKGFYGYQTNNLTIDGMVVREDPANLNSGAQRIDIKGIKFDDYLTHNITIQNSDIQGAEEGIDAPIYVGHSGGNPGAPMDVTTIQNCFLDNVNDIVVTPPRTVGGSPSDMLPQTIDIVNVRAANPSDVNVGEVGSSSLLSLGYVTQDALGTSNMSVWQYVFVTDWNGASGDNFQVYYSETPSPTGTLPLGAQSRPGINGKVVPR